MAAMLEGRTALVTGAGRGIGRAIALRLAEQGAAVALAARSRDQLEAVAAEVRALGGRAMAIACDVAAEGAAPALADRTERELGPLDILVNAAGISPVYTRSERLATSDWDTILNTNLRAAFLLCQAAGIRMLERGRGAIVNVTSIAAAVALPRVIAYSAAKAGLLAVTRVLAVEWAQRGVRVNAVAPGYVMTEMTRGLAAHPSLGPQLVAQTPMGRLAEPSEISGAVLYLVSDAASYVTGQTIYVDGGWTAQ